LQKQQHTFATTPKITYNNARKKRKRRMKEQMRITIMKATKEQVIVMRRGNVLL